MKFMENSQQIGGERLSQILPSVSFSRLRAHLTLCKKHGISFNYLLNAANSDNTEYTREGQKQLGAIAFLAELGDLSRLENPHQLMAYLGLTPSERSTGESVKRSGITKGGNTRLRRLLIGAAWSYRFPPRVSKDMQIRIGAAPRTAREIAWKAEMRLCGRFPDTDAEGQAADDRGDGDRPRAVSLHLGDQP